MTESSATSSNSAVSFNAEKDEKDQNHKEVTKMRIKTNVKAGLSLNFTKIN